LALVDDDLSAVVEEGEDVVAGDGMALGAHDIAVDGFFAEDNGLPLRGRGRRSLSA
jgi:hypothetical protein